MTWLSGADLHHWRRQQLADWPGPANGLDWLLDLEGGLSWRELQSSHLHPERGLELRCGLDHLAGLWKRHCIEQVPLQHLVGRCPWRDLELAVSKDVLIPRQETELLVELACDLPLASGELPRRWADLGTGSGCVALALARQWPASEGWAVDRSPEALAVARANGEAQNEPMASLHWCVGDWWQPLTPLAGTLELVVSNPPYIPSAVVDVLDPVVRDHEPRLALDGGSDGLDSLRSIIKSAPRMLAPGGWLLVEHHHDQSQAVLGLMQQADLVDCRSASDLEGNARFALARQACS